ncbi:MAG: C-type lectin domain-containing protein [Myxococcales bacterium]|nr:C-type lectin domain-containing protein [Myxococcales bacterium]
MTVDAAPDARPADAAPDRTVPDMAAIDAATEDEGPIDAAPPDAAVDAAPDACVGQGETCNGFDDDCDGRLDEEADGCDPLVDCAVRTWNDARYLFCPSPVTHANAQQLCARRGLALVVTETRDELDWVWATGRALSAGPWWLGYRMQVVDGTRQAVRIDGKVIEEALWLVGEPNNKLGGEDCVDLYTNEDEAYGWNDEQCAQTGVGTVCELITP